MMQRRALRVVKSSDKPQPPFPKTLFERNWYQLPINQNQALMIMIHTGYWWTEEGLPFVSNGTTAKLMKVTRRTVERLKRDLRQKGLLRCLPRFEGKRETSSEMDYGPLREELFRVTGSDTRDGHGPIGVSEGGPIGVSDWNHNSSTKSSSPKKRDRDVRTTSIPDGVLDSVKMDRDELDGSLRSSGHDPVTPAPTENPDEEETMVDRPKNSLANLKAVIVDANVKFEQDAKTRDERKAERARTKAERRAGQADQQDDQSARAWAAAKEIEDEWNTAVEEHHPRAVIDMSPKKEDRKRIIGQFQQLLSSWGVENAKRTIWAAVVHWDLYTRPLKNPPKTPHLGFFLACKKHFASNIVLIEDYENALEAVAKWKMTKKPHEVRPPVEMDKALQSVVAELRVKGFLAK